ncbi:MAG: uncharacterized protein JWL62_3151, partial [Hyphomicrobiales bacterium]|nr:uncharacterized protein [Hyphomicrobiales bacterium]
GFVTAIAADAGSLESAGVQLDKFVQIPVRVAGSQDGAARWLMDLLETPKAPEHAALDATHSRLDEKLDGGETTLLATLAPLAGASPREIKRFANLYRLARVSSADRPVLALMLAIAVGGNSAERDGLRQALNASGPTLMARAGDERLAWALAAVESQRGAPVDMTAARTAHSLAETFSLRA